MKWPKITKDTPMSNMQIIHKQIWDYVIEHDEKPKTPYFCDCVCCEYNGLRNRHKCDDCPAIWPEYSDCYIIYQQWLVAPTREERTMLAKQIRDVPFKEDSR